MTQKRRIGSFFESPDLNLLNSLKTPPWEDGRPITYVQTCRQALAAVAKVYAAEGRNLLLVPEYLCGSMLVGFDKNQWSLIDYKLNSNLTIDSNHLLTRVANPLKTVVLSATYFGNEPDDRHIAAIESLRSRGARVIEDETHRVLGNLQPIGDVAVASLRKVLPVADGAYIRGAFDLNPGQGNEHEGWLAMDEKYSHNIDAANVTFQKASLALKEWIMPPVQLSQRSKTVLSLLDYEEMGNRRRENANALRNYLHDLSTVTVINNAEIPSHLLIKVSNPLAVQSGLAARSIFCPIHWPKPERLKDLQWRSDLLSLPIDHRYNIKDMSIIAEHLQEVVSIV